MVTEPTNNTIIKPDVEGVRANPLQEAPQEEPVYLASLGGTIAKVLTKAFARKTSVATSSLFKGAKDIIEAGPVPGEEVMKRLSKMADKKVSGSFEEDAIEFIEKIQPGAMPTVEEARRGVQTWDMSKAKARTKEVVKKLGKAVEAQLSKKPGTALNAEEIASLNMLELSVAKEFKRVSDLITEGGSVSLEDDATMFRLARLISALRLTRKGASAEAGRALNIHKMEAEPGTQARLDQLFEFMYRKGGKLDAQEMAYMISKGDGTIDNAQKVVKIKTRIVKGAFEYWVNSILSSFKTHFINMTGNLSSQFYEDLKTVGAGGVGSLRRFVTGKKDGVYMGEALISFAQRASGFWDALTMCWDSSARGQYYKQFGGTTKLERSENILGGTIGEYLRKPGSLLEFEDVGFKIMAYRSMLGQRMYREAAQNGVPLLKRQAWVKDRMKQLENVDLKMSNDILGAHYDSVAHADKVTYTQSLKSDKKDLRPTLDNLIDRVAGGIQNAAEGYPALRFLVPFIRTPANLGKYALDNSLLAIATGTWWDDMLAGGARRDSAIARYGMAAGYTSIMVYAAQNGQLTGNGPADITLRKEMELGGWEPNSWKIGKKWYKYDRLDPLGGMIGIVADTLDYMNYSTEDATTTDLFASMLIAVLETLGNKTYLESAADMFGIINAPDKMDQIMKSGSRVLSGFVPYSGMVGMVRYMGDPTIKETKNPNSPALQFWNKVKNRIPYASSTIPISIDWKGDYERRTMSTPAGYILPIEISAIKGDRASLELVNNNIAVDQIKHTFTFPGTDFIINTVSLDNNDGFIYQKYQQIVGKERHKMVNELLSQDIYYELLDSYGAGPYTPQAALLGDMLEMGRTIGMMKFIDWYKTSDRKEKFPDSINFGDTGVIEEYRERALALKEKGKQQKKDAAIRFPGIRKHHGVIPKGIKKTLGF